MSWPVRRRVDALVVVVSAAEALAALVGADPGRFLAAFLLALSAVALLLRRRAPFPASVLALALVTSGILASPRSPGLQFIGVMVTFAVVAGINTTRDGLIAGGIGAVLIGVVAALGDPGAWAADAALTLLFASAMWGAGWLVSRHTRRADLMALRATTAEQARALAVRDERARIARELHDVVSHGLSVVVLQTVAARGALLDSRADLCDRHLDAVESAARDALTEMRRMLGLLDADEITDSESTAPRPGLPDLEALLARARDAGLVVDADPIPPIEVGPGLGLAAYRVVQESLTNAAKHAANSRVRVAVSAGRGDLVVEVVDDGGAGPVPGIEGSGRGLLGMRERIALYGGALETGGVPGGGFRVRAVLPLSAAELEAHR